MNWKMRLSLGLGIAVLVMFLSGAGQICYQLGVIHGLEKALEVIKNVEEDKQLEDQEQEDHLYPFY